MMAGKHLVVIGNGPAGREAAACLREADPKSRITLISQERWGHYQPRLLPRFIAGRMEESELVRPGFDFYEERGIKLRLGQRVVGLDPEQKMILLDHREMVPFSGLVIAVGGRPRIPEPLLVFKELMLTLKTLGQAHVWKERLARTEDVLIVGGDLTSMTLVKTLLDMGKRVLFVFSQEALWPNRCTPELLEEVSAKLRAQGVEVLEGRLRSLVQKPEGRLEAVLDRTRVEVGLVGAFFGLVPEVGFLARSGLRIERGILVDQRLSTGFEGIYAAGDCAQVYHPDLRDYWVSIGVENASCLGRIAAANLMGGAERASAPLESIFSDQGVKANTSWWMEF
jgi:NADPH-dependent 2,4-dienoyl-CoA reductase/sulfur reductase-like enzyme